MPTLPRAAKKPQKPKHLNQKPSTPNFDLLDQLSRRGYQTIIGVDEVGRGALAGPVVVAAIQVTRFIPGVTDSKQIPKEGRTRLAHQLQQTCQLIRVGQVSNEEIDEIGMTRALALAYARALEGVSADLVLTDHLHLPTHHRFIRATRGDSLFYPVAAASIIAKTYRDQLMTTYHRFFPEYGWSQNAGYGTKTHQDTIISRGQTPLHRKTFTAKKTVVE